MIPTNPIKLDNKKPEPKFYACNLIATDYTGERHIYLFTTIAMSQQDAFMKGLDTMRRQIPELYELGQTGTGFSILGCQELTWRQMQRNFLLAIEPRPTQNIQFVVAEEPVEEPEEPSEKNKLIQKIIETRDTELLEQSKDQLTDYEIAYITDTIK